MRYGIFAVAGAALSVASASTQAAPVSTPMSGLRATAEVASLIENAASRRCWWRNGMLYCSRYAYAPQYRQPSPARSGIEIMLGIGY